MEVGKKCLYLFDLNPLVTTVYSKPIVSHIYLHAKSCHENSTNRGIQKGVALRLRRISSTDEEYTPHLTAWEHDNLMENTFKKTSSKSRTVAIRKNEKMNTINLVIFPTSYTTRGPSGNCHDKHSSTRSS